MTYILTPLQGILVLVLNLIAPLIVLICLPFIRLDGFESVGPQRTNQPTPTEMADWPARLAGLAEENTPAPYTSPATDYKQQRAAEYPPIADYLDAVVKNDQVVIVKYIEDCNAVKLKYPKPEEVTSKKSKKKSSN